MNLSTDRERVASIIINARLGAERRGQMEPARISISLEDFLIAESIDGVTTMGVGDDKYLIYGPISIYAEAH